MPKLRLCCSPKYLGTLLLALLTTVSCDLTNCSELVSGTKSWQGSRLFIGCKVVSQSVIIAPTGPLTLVLRNVTWSGGTFTLQKSTIGNAAVLAENSTFSGVTDAICVRATSATNVTLGMINSTSKSSSCALSLIVSIATDVELNATNCSITSGAAAVGISSNNLQVNDARIYVTGSVISATAPPDFAVAAGLLSTGGIQSSCCVLRAERSSIRTSGRWTLVSLGILANGAVLQSTNDTIIAVDSIVATVGTSVEVSIGLLSYHSRVFSTNTAISIIGTQATVRASSHSAVVLGVRSTSGGVGINCTFSAVDSFIAVDALSWASTSSYPSMCAGFGGGSSTGTTFRVCNLTVSCVCEAIHSSSPSIGWTNSLLNSSITATSCVTQSLNVGSVIRNTRLSCSVQTGNPRGNYSNLSAYNITNKAGTNITGSAFPGSRVELLGPYALFSSCPMEWLKLSLMPNPNSCWTLSSSPSSSLPLPSSVSRHISWSASRSSVSTRSPTDTSTVTISTLSKSTETVSLPASYTVSRHQIKRRNSNSTFVLPLPCFSVSSSSTVASQRRPSAFLRSLDGLGTRVLVATGIGSSVVAGFVTSPGVATRAMRMSSVASAAYCSFRTDSDSKPDYADFPIHAPLGNGTLSQYAGSAVASTGVCLILPAILMFLVAALGRRLSAASSLRPRVRKVQEQFLSSAFYIGLAFEGPTVLSSLLPLSGQGATTTELVAVSLATLFAGVLTVVVGAVVLVLFPRWFQWVDESSDNVPRKGSAFQTFDDSSMLLESFGALFDAARSDALVVRSYYLEEFATSLLFQCLSDIPPSSGSCGTITVCMICAAAAHFLFLAFVRPYHDQVEFGFAITAALLLLGMSLCATGATYMNSISALLLTALEVMMSIQNALFFLQLVIMASMSAWARHRRRLEKQWSASIEDGASDSKPCLTAPLIQESPQLSSCAAYESKSLSRNPLFH